MRLNPKFAVLFAVFSKGRKDKMWVCSGAFVLRSRADTDAAIEQGRKRKTIIKRIRVERPKVAP